MTGWFLAAQIAIVAHGPDTLAACTPFQITAAARAHGTVAPQLDFPNSARFQLLHSSLASRLELDPAGNSFGVTEGVFLVATASTGHLQLPGITATVGARRARSAPVELSVYERPRDDDDPRVLVRAMLSDQHGRIATSVPFVGQQVNYVVDVQMNDAARRRLRRNPTFFPPDMPAVLAYDVDVLDTVRRSERRCFESLTYRRAIFPLFPGRTVIPPATLAYALPVSASFFSREETHELRTDSLELIAVEPPPALRPEDYLGAVGAFRVSARLGSPRGRMGDPLLFTLRIEGWGNVKLLPRPALSVAWAAVVSGPERVEIDSSHGRVRGAKEVDWLLTPRQAGSVRIAAVRYPYFDPERAVYDVALTSPVELDVAPASLAVSDTAVATRLTIRTHLRDERGPLLPDRGLFWLLLALAPMPATFRRAIRRRKIAASTPSAAKRLQTADRGSLPLPSVLRRLYIEALCERIPTLDPAAARTPVSGQLRRAGVTATTSDAAQAFLEELDAVVFSGGGTLRTGATTDAVRIVREIDVQAVHIRMGARSRSVVLMVCLSAAGATAVALPTDEGVAQTFADGVLAYGAGNVRLAQRDFARVAARAPRSPDAWANVAAVAWATGDTAQAASGWQRALRLDPLDAETRERLALLQPAITARGRGYVPPLSIDAVAVLALTLWILGWLAMALPAARRRAAVRPVAAGTILAAIIALGATLELRRRLDIHRLGVLRQSRTLLTRPTPAAQAATSGFVGEVGEMGAREGMWLRIVLDGTRAGWVPASAVLPLGDVTSD